MPAVKGGTGFVGFGDYENANEGQANEMAQSAQASNPDLTGDAAAVGTDIGNVESEVSPWLQQQQSSAVAGDANPVNLNPTVTTVAGQNVGNNGKDMLAIDQTSTPSAYQGQTQGQADYNQWETSNGGGTGKGMGTGGRAGANENDPNNPYSVNNAGTVGALENNPSVLSGYGQYQADTQKQATDQQQTANENTWGGAFGQLQASNTAATANGGGKLNAAGTGTGFDALLSQGAMSPAADKAAQQETTDPEEAMALSSGIASAAGGVANPWGAQTNLPAAPAAPKPEYAPAPGSNPHASSQLPGVGLAGGWHSDLPEREDYGGGGTY